MISEFTLSVRRRCGHVAIVALAILAATAAQAQTLEEQYLTERDTMRAILRVMAATDIQMPSRPLANLMGEEDGKALAALAPKLRALIGPVEIKGWQAQKMTRPETLTTEMGSTALDSLVFKKSPEDWIAALHVSTEALLLRWLSDWQKDSRYTDQASRIPTQIASALRADNFYTFATWNDSGTETLAEIRLKKRPEAKHLVALLAGRTQDLTVSTPDRLIVTAVQGGLVFIAEVPLKMKFGPIKECPVEGEEPGSEYQKCFAAHAPEYKAYIAAAKQAQELYDTLPL